MNYQNILFEIKNHTGLVTVNRPDKLNTLNGQTIDELEDIFRSIKNNPEVFHLCYDFKSIEGKVLNKVNSLSESVNEDLLGGNILSCNGVFIRTDIASKHRFNPDRELAATEDYVLWLQLASRYTFHNKNIITSSVVDHESRSVIKINRDKLIKRKELSIKYLKEDEVFMRKYGNKIRKIEADTYTYIALHLAIAKYSVTDSISYLFRSLQVRKRSICEKRFWGTLKTILVR